MNSREVASLALKLLGVYAIIQALPLLQFIPYLAALMDQAGRRNMGMRPSDALLGIIPLLALAGVACVLLTRSDELARKMVPEDREISVGGLSGPDVQTIAFSVAGVIVFLLGLPALCQTAVRLASLGPQYYGIPSSPDRGRQSLNFVLSGLGPILQCVLGAVLFFRSRAVSTFWRSRQSTRS
jgi:hypothetical protein